MQRSPRQRAIDCIAAKSSSRGVDDISEEIFFKAGEYATG
jgi:hypothetical protein